MTQASAEKLEHTRLAEKCQKRLDAIGRVVGKYAGAALVKKEKEPSRQSKALDHEGGKVKENASRILARERKIGARARKAKSGLHCQGRVVPRRTGRASKKRLPRRGRRKHELVSGRKSSPRLSVES